MKYWIIGFGSLLGIAAIIGGVWAFRYFTAPISGRVEAQVTIQSGANRIQAYNHFFDLYAAIKSYDALIKAQEDELASTTSTDEQERIRANIAGIRGQKARAIQQYNADAKKSYTIGQFRDWQLPYQIED